MSCFILHLEGNLTHQQLCALVVASNGALGLDAATLGTSLAKPYVPHRWEYVQDNTIAAPLRAAAHDLQEAPRG